MALTRLNSFATGSVVTNAIATGEFDNIYNNALTLISPLTGDLAAGGNRITGLSAGSLASPSLQFTSDANTGIYSPAAEQVAIVCAGAAAATFTTGAVGPHAIGGATANNVRLGLLGSFTSGGVSTTGAKLVIGGALTGASGDTDYLADVVIGGGGITTQAVAESVAVGASLYLNEPAITIGAGSTLTSSATLYIAGPATEATNNYSLLVASGNVQIGGTTANANMTLGLTVNQGGADNEILTLKSSDVAHGITTVTETDAYGVFSKGAGATGGLVLRGIGTASIGLFFLGTVTTANTTKSTAGTGTIRFDARLKSGTGETASGADANLVTIQDNGTTRFIFDAEGSAHADVEWIAFQDHDDVTLLKNLERHLARGARPTGPAAAAERLELQSLGLVAPEGVDASGQPVRGLVNLTRLHMLHTGATRQAHDLVDVLLDDLLARRSLSPQERARIPAGIRARKGIAP